MAISISNREDLTTLFGVLGNIISFLVFLAPVPTFYRICKNKCTEGFQSVPYLVALFSCTLWLYYGMLQHDALYIKTINLVGCVVEIIYIAIYITFAHREARNVAIKLLVVMNISTFGLIFLVTHFFLQDSQRVKVLGGICVFVSVCVFASPLSIIAQVVRTKSVQFMPFSLSCFLTLSAVMWFGYGVFLKDKCVAIPNVVGFILGVVQMVLYWCYRKGGSGVKRVTTTTEINIVVVNPLALGIGNGEVPVFPIPDDVEDQQLQAKKNVDAANQKDCPV